MEHVVSSLTESTGNIKLYYECPEVATKSDKINSQDLFCVAGPLTPLTIQISNN